MNSKLDLVVAYRAYANVLDQGESVDGGYRLHGLTAYTDHDGYTVTLCNGTVSARLMFHSKIQFDTPNSRALQRFVRQVTDVARLTVPAKAEPQRRSSIPLLRVPELSII
ncbi:MAG: DUF3081 family protein [Pseudomonadota bacterium]